MKDSFKSIEDSRSEGIQEVYKDMGMPDLGQKMAKTLMQKEKLQKMESELDSSSEIESLMNNLG